MLKACLVFGGNEALQFFEAIQHDYTPSSFAGQDQELFSKFIAQTVTVGGKLIEYRSDLIDHILAFRQEQHSSSADHRHSSATRHHPSLPFIDEKLGTPRLREHDRFRFSAIEELRQFGHVGAFGNVLARKPTLFFGLRQSERTRSGRWELKLLEHRSWD